MARGEIIQDYTANWLHEDIYNETFNARKLEIEEILFQGKFNLKYYKKFGVPVNEIDLLIYYEKFDLCFFRNKKIKEYEEILDKERKKDNYINQLNL